MKLPKKSLEFRHENKLEAANKTNGIIIFLDGKKMPLCLKKRDTHSKNRKRKITSEYWSFSPSGNGLGSLIKGNADKYNKNKRSKIFIFLINFILNVSFYPVVYYPQVLMQYTPDLLDIHLLPGLSAIRIS